MPKDNEFDVMNMLDSYADENDINPADVFKRPEPKPVGPKKPAKERPANVNGINPELVADMPEFAAPGAVYDKDEIHMGNEPLKDMADEDAIKESSDTMDDLKWKETMIEEAKRRHNIDKLHIPEGETQVRMLIAASAGTKAEAQRELDAVLDDIANTYPDMIEYKAGGKPTEQVTEFPTVTDEEIEAAGDVEVEEFGTQAVPVAPSVPDVEAPKPTVSTSSEATDEDATKVVIDKRNLPDVSWSPEEVERIKRSRTVELNIVEGANVDFGSIQDVDTSNIDSILAKYQRKTNDVPAALPASKYRATFTGLTYPEVIDLSTSNEMNNLDGERKKWSICFDHLKNQSIGPWQEYYTYKDPNTRQTKRVETATEIPDTIRDEDIHFVSRFEDFLRKTSYMDLEFMLWKILCATAMPEEIISIECNSRNNGKVCGNTYDWIYRPAELLSVESISPAVLEELRVTGEASSYQEIMENYKTSPVHANNYVKLATSGLLAVYGHVSAYEYLNDVYGKLHELTEQDADKDPTLLSRTYAYTVLTCIKAFIIPDPDENGNYQRITGTDNLMKVIMTLDEIDWETLSELTRMMIEPYQFKFVMKDIVCPKCHSKSAIQIDSMSRLLFILARSLQSVQVSLIGTSNS